MAGGWTKEEGRGGPRHTRSAPQTGVCLGTDGKWHQLALTSALQPPAPSAFSFVPLFLDDWRPQQLPRPFWFSGLRILDLTKPGLWPYSLVELMGTGGGGGGTTSTKKSFLKAQVGPWVDVLFNTFTCQKLLDCTDSKAHTFKEEWQETRNGKGDGGKSHCIVDSSLSPELPCPTRHLFVRIPKPLLKTLHSLGASRIWDIVGTQMTPCTTGGNGNPLDPAPCDASSM